MNGRDSSLQPEAIIPDPRRRIEEARHPPPKRCQEPLSEGATPRSRSGKKVPDTFLLAVELCRRPGRRGCSPSLLPCLGVYSVQIRAGQEAIGVLQHKPEERIPGKGIELLLTERIHHPGLCVVVDHAVDKPCVFVADTVVQGGHDHEIVHRRIAWKISIVAANDADQALTA